MIIRLHKYENMLSTLAIMDKNLENLAELALKKFDFKLEIL